VNKTPPYFSLQMTNDLPKYGRQYYLKIESDWYSVGYDMGYIQYMGVLFIVKNTKHAKHSWFGRLQQFDVINYSLFKFKTK